MIQNLKLVYRGRGLKWLEESQLSHEKEKWVDKMEKLARSVCQLFFIKVLCVIDLLYLQTFD